MAGSGGGAERVLAAVTSALAQRGYSIYLLTFDEPGLQSFYKLDPGIQILNIGIGNVKRPATLIESVNRIRAIRSIVKKIKPDCVIGFMNSIYTPLSFALLGLNIPIIASEHTVYQHYRTKPFQRLLIQWLSFTYKRITVVSEQAMRSFPFGLHKRMSIINNPILLDFDGTRANTLGKMGQRKILLSVGRLSLEKDQATLIEAFGKIAKLLPDWDLHIAGEGEQRKELESIINRFNLKDRVLLIGTVSDVSNLYLSANLFAMTSVYESFGLTTVEALSYGLPVIAFSDCLGINALVKDNNNGILVEPGVSKCQSFADGLFLLMSNDELRSRLAENCKLLDGYEIHEVTDSWVKLVQDITLSMHKTYPITTH